MANTDMHEPQVVQTDVSFRHEVQYRFSIPDPPSLEQWHFTRDFKTICPILPTDWRLKVSFRKDSEVVACIINIERLDSRECLVRGKFDLDLFCVSGSDSWRICRPIHFKIPGMISGQEMAFPVLSLNRMKTFGEGNLYVEARLRINGCCYWTAPNILNSQKADDSSSFSLGDQLGKVCTIIKNLPSNVVESIKVEELIKIGTELLRLNKANANGPATVLQLMKGLLKYGIKLLGSNNVNAEESALIAQFVNEVLMSDIDVLRSNNANTNGTAAVTPSKL